MAATTYSLHNVAAFTDEQINAVSSAVRLNKEGLWAAMDRGVTLRRIHHEQLILDGMGYRCPHCMCPDCKMLRETSTSGEGGGVWAESSSSWMEWTSNIMEVGAMFLALGMRSIRA